MPPRAHRRQAHGKDARICFKCRRPLGADRTIQNPHGLPYGQGCIKQIKAAVRVLRASGNPVAIAAARLLMAGALTPNGRPGTWSARSEADVRVHYIVTEEACACPQGQRFPDRLCKHRMAAGVLAA
jgi:hypothetical protein